MSPTAISPTTHAVHRPCPGRGTEHATGGGRRCRQDDRRRGVREDHEAIGAAVRNQLQRPSCGSTVGPRLLRKRHEHAAVGDVERESRPQRRVCPGLVVPDDAAGSIVDGEDPRGKDVLADQSIDRGIGEVARVECDADDAHRSPRPEHQALDQDERTTRLPGRCQQRRLTQPPARQPVRDRRGNSGAAGAGIDQHAKRALPGDGHWHDDVARRLQRKRSRREIGTDGLDDCKPE